MLPSNDHFNEFEKLLETCQKLRSLCFQNTYYQRKGLGYAENLLNILIKAAPANLRDIKFSYDIEISLIVLQGFLEKWRGRPAISIFVRCLSFRSDYVNLINEFKNEGVIKD